jgi:carotenoid 1,2-hydratase
MTERGRASLDRSARHIAIAGSSMRWSDGHLIIEIDERCSPVPRRLVGTVSVEAGPLFDRVHSLDAAGLHRWRPFAPRARVSVAFSQPGVAWSGSAYCDLNAGDEPLERAFRYWTWSRSTAAERTRIHYDLEARDGERRSLSFDYCDDASIIPAPAPPLVELPETLWRVRRALRNEEAAVPAGIVTMEDTPFYTRTRALPLVAGRRLPTICESVDLDRFASRWVQALLPFRMPRLTRRN